MIVMHQAVMANKPQIPVYLLKETQDAHHRSLSLPLFTASRYWKYRFVTLTGKLLTVHSPPRSS